MKLAKKMSLLFGILLCGMLILTACGGSNYSQQNDKPEQFLEDTSDYQPVTIENNDRTITFEKKPTRAVTLNQHVTEVMLALGLEDYMVGTAYLDDEILPELRGAFEKIHVLSDKYPSQEVFLSVEPDFAYAGWGSAFRDDNVGTVEQLEQFGIKAYLHKSSSVVGPTIDDVFADILNIGRIFNVEDKANELISNMEQGLAEVSSQVGNVEKPLRVFAYDSGEDAPYTVARNFMNTLIKMAGGQNIFEDVEKNWAQVSWEEVVNRDPELIIIIDYGDTAAEQKIEFLLSNPALQNVTAIVNQRFVVLPLSAAAEGVRLVDALKSIAKEFYPDNF